MIHGVPYFALIYFYGRAHGSPESVTRRLLRRGPFALLGIVWVLAFIEEAVWDHTLWHEHPQFFGQGFSLESVGIWLVPLLAVPQLTHYVLDGFIWRRRSAQPLFVTSAPAVVAAGVPHLAPENL